MSRSPISAAPDPVGAAQPGGSDEPGSGQRVREAMDVVPPPARIPAEALELVAGDDAEVDVFVDFPSRPTMLSLPVPVAQFGRFHIVGRLAVGGMADIFLAQEQTPGSGTRHVVVKLVRSSLSDDSDFEQMFLREGRVAMQLTHPNVCHVYEFGKWGGHLFIAMEWVDGVHLRQLFERLQEREQKLPPTMVAWIGAEVAAALDHAHNARDSRRRRLNVVHRDVTPHNIMISYDGIVKLLDFGVAAVREEEKASDSDDSSMLKGKFGYFSPEQCQGLRIDGRSDLFTLGVCLFEALSMQRLYKRESQLATFEAIVREAPPSIREIDPEVPEELDAILQKALAKDPAVRWGSASELEQALRGFLTHKGEVVSSSQMRDIMEPAYREEIARGPKLDRSDGAIARLAVHSDHPPLSTRPAPLGTIWKRTGDPAQGIGARLEPERATATEWLRKPAVWIGAGLLIALTIALLIVFSSGPEPAPDGAATAGSEARPRVEGEPGAGAGERVEPTDREPPGTQPEIEAETTAGSAVAQQPEQSDDALEQQRLERERERDRDRQRKRRPTFFDDPGF